MNIFRRIIKQPDIGVGQIWNLKRHKDQLVKIVIVEDGFVTYVFSNGYCSSQARSIKDFLKLYEFYKTII